MCKVYLVLYSNGQKCSPANLAAYKQQSNKVHFTTNVLKTGKIS